MMSDERIAIAGENDVEEFLLYSSFFDQAVSAAVRRKPIRELIANENKQ
jgi:hypothetical protein